MNLQEKKREADMIRSVTFISNGLSVRQLFFSFETMNGLKRCIRSSSLNLEKEKLYRLSLKNSDGLSVICSNIIQHSNLTSFFRTA